MMQSFSDLPQNCTLEQVIDALPATLILANKGNAASYVKMQFNGGWEFRLYFATRVLQIYDQFGNSREFQLTITEYDFFMFDIWKRAVTPTFYPVA